MSSALLFVSNPASWLGEKIKNTRIKAGAFFGILTETF